LNGIKYIARHHYHRAGKYYPAFVIGFASLQDIILVFRGEWVFADDDVCIAFQFWEVNLFYFSLIRKSELKKWFLVQFQLGIPFGFKN